MKYRIFWTNFDYYSQEEFLTKESAIEYARSKCFEFQIVYDGKTICSWSVFGGMREY